MPPPGNISLTPILEPKNPFAVYTINPETSFGASGRRSSDVCPIYTMAANKTFFLRKTLKGLRLIQPDSRREIYRVPTAAQLGVGAFFCFCHLVFDSARRSVSTEAPEAHGYYTTVQSLLQLPPPRVSGLVRSPCSQNPHFFPPCLIDAMLVQLPRRMYSPAPLPVKNR